MPIISPVADYGVLAGHPLEAEAGAAHQPASYDASLFDHPAATTYVAGRTAPSSLPSFPSTVTSSWASNSAPSPLYQQRPWQQQQPAALGSFSFLGNHELQSGYDNLSTMIANFFPPQSAPAPFAQPAVPPQPKRQMQPAMQAHPSQAMVAAPVLEAVPLAVMPATVTTDHPVRADTRTGQAAKPAPRRRGRPPKITTAASKPATARTNRAAPRRTASVINSAATSGQVQQPAEQPANAVAVAATDETAPCTNPTALPHQEQRQLQSTSNTPSTGNNEAAIGEEVNVSYADTSAAGVRFHPTKEEIIGYLEMKYHGRKMPVDFIKDFDVYQAHPETVKDTCGEDVDGCWYVFSPRDRRYGKGLRPARSVGRKKLGFWKSNTKETDIRVDGKADSAVIGKVTALTFHLGKQPKGKQTPWRMKEYSIPGNRYMPDGSLMLLDDWVLCKIFCKGRRIDKNEQIVPVEQRDQSGDPDEDAGEAGDADEQMVPVDQILSNSEQDLCVEDYIVCDPTLAGLNLAAN